MPELIELGFTIRLLEDIGKCIPNCHGEDAHGSLIMGSSGTEGGIKGRYRLIDKDQLEMDFGGRKTTHKYEIKGDNPDLTSDDGPSGRMTLTFKRVK
jgi:hypothetical protein